MRIGFLGAGNLARAMVQSLLKEGDQTPSDLRCLSGSGATAQRLSDDLGIALAESRQDLFEQSDIIVLAFKPQHLETISEEDSKLASGKLIISVLAGRTLNSLSDHFPSARNIARVMPNTPAKIGKGVSAFCYAENPSEEDKASVESLLESFGYAYQVDEPQMHIATALSGCGPALFFRFIDVLANAAAEKGIPKDLALEVAIKTGLGSLELMRQSNQDPQTLIDEVVSPNGVTHALLESLKNSDWHYGLENGITDAVNRSIELAGER